MVDTYCRVKLIEREREIEKLDTQLKNASKGKATMKRSGSQDDDLAKKLGVVEKEASVLRDRNAALENENDRLANDNKQLLKDMVMYINNPLGRVPKTLIDPHTFAGQEAALFHPRETVYGQVCIGREGQEAGTGAQRQRQGGSQVD